MGHANIPNEVSGPCEGQWTKEKGFTTWIKSRLEEQLQKQPDDDPFLKLIVNIEWKKWKRSPGNCWSDTDTEAYILDLDDESQELFSLKELEEIDQAAKDEMEKIGAEKGGPCD